MKKKELNNGEKQPNQESNEDASKENSIDGSIEEEAKPLPISKVTDHDVVVTLRSYNLWGGGSTHSI